MNTKQQTDVNKLPLIRRNVNLRPYNTLQVEAFADRFAVVRDVNQLSGLHAAGFLKEQPLILGGGSNILFRNRVKRLVIKNEITFREVLEEDGSRVILNVGAGTDWHDLVSFSVHQNWGGIENLALIPGSVGAAPVQNIGAYGVELKDCFVSLQAFDLKEGVSRTFVHEECRFGYRDSVFKRDYIDRYIITSVAIRLKKPPHVVSGEYQSLKSWLERKRIHSPGVKDIYEGVIDIRTQKLPAPSEIGNAGSFFKNPVVANSVLERVQKKFSNVPYYPQEEGYVKIPAGWLIEKAGWKGKRVGRVGTYENQALVIVNHGGATGDEIWNLSCRISQSVKEKFGIELVPEVKIIGLPDESCD